MLSIVCTCHDAKLWPSTPDAVSKYSCMAYFNDTYYSRIISKWTLLWQPMSRWEVVTVTIHISCIRQCPLQPPQSKFPPNRHQKRHTIMSTKRFTRHRVLLHSVFTTSCTYRDACLQKRRPMRPCISWFDKKYFVWQHLMGTHEVDLGSGFPKRTVRNWLQAIRFLKYHKKRARWNPMRCDSLHWFDNSSDTWSCTLFQRTYSLVSRICLTVWVLATKHYLRPFNHSLHLIVPRT